MIAFGIGWGFPYLDAGLRGRVVITDEGTGGDCYWASRRLRDVALFMSTFANGNSRSWPRRSAALTTVTLGLLAGACDRQEKQAEAPVRPVRVMTVAEQQAGETVTLSGIVEAKTEVDLAFRIGGRMITRFVNVGDRVEAGQLIAQLDSQDEENAVRAAKANLSAAEGKFLEAEQNYDRQRQLLSRGHTTRQRYDAAVQTLNTLRGQADVARAQLATAKTRLNDTNLYADAPGEVTVRVVNTGEVVQAGQMIVRIARKEGRDAVFDAPPGLIAGDRAMLISLWHSRSIRPLSRRGGCARSRLKQMHRREPSGSASG